MKAYTLIETIAVLVIVGIVAAIGVPMILETADAWVFSSRLQNNAVVSAIVAANRISREIRGLKNDTSIINATASQLTFRDISNNNITYKLTGNTLMRNAEGLTDNVNAFNFTYFNDTEAVIATPLVSPNNTNIRRIQVDFAISVGAHKLNFASSVRPQNLKRLNEKFK